MEVPSCEAWEKPDCRIDKIDGENKLDGNNNFACRYRGQCVLALIEKPTYLEEPLRPVELDLPLDRDWRRRRSRRVRS